MCREPAKKNSVLPSPFFFFFILNKQNNALVLIFQAEFWHILGGRCAYYRPKVLSTSEEQNPPSSFGQKDSAVVYLSYSSFYLMPRVPEIVAICVSNCNKCLNGIYVLLFHFCNTGTGSQQGKPSKGLYISISFKLWDRETSHCNQVSEELQKDTSPACQSNFFLHSQWLY